MEQASPEGPKRIPADHALPLDYVQRVYATRTRYGREASAAGCVSYPPRHVVQARLPDLLTDAAVGLAEVAEHYTRSTPRLLREAYHVFRSAGSGGQYAFWLYDARAWAAFIVATEWHLRFSGVTDADRIACVGSADPRHTLPRLAAELGFPRCQSFGLQVAVAETLEQLADFAPTVLVGFSSAIFLLARSALECRTSWTPRVVVCNTDSLTEPYRETIAAAWGVEPRQAVSATELGLMLFQCPEGNFHANTTHIHFGNRKGRIHCTNLTNTIQPIVNLECPMPLAFEPGACGCGAEYPRARPLSAGRVVELLRLPRQGGGCVDVHPIGIRSLVDAAGTAREVSWRLNRHELRIHCPGAGEVGALEARIREQLRKTGVDTTITNVRVTG